MSSVGARSRARFRNAGLRRCVPATARADVPTRPAIAWHDRPCPRTHRRKVAPRCREHTIGISLEAFRDRQAEPQRASRLTRQTAECRSRSAFASIRRRRVPTRVARLLAVAQVSLVPGQGATRLSRRTSRMAGARAAPGSPPSLLLRCRHWLQFAPDGSAVSTHNRRASAQIRRRSLSVLQGSTCWVEGTDRAVIMGVVRRGEVAASRPVRRILCRECPDLRFRVLFPRAVLRSSSKFRTMPVSRGHSAPVQVDEVDEVDEEASRQLAAYPVEESFAGHATCASPSVGAGTAHADVPRGMRPVLVSRSGRWPLV